IPHHTELYGSTPKTSLPIVYHSDYNITFMGLEKLHPFDAGKWGKVIHFLKGAIKRRVELDWGTEDSEYLQKVELHCDGALNEVRPDVIVYNAGTDILDGDPLGGLSISPHGIVKRDELVFRAARRRGIPILMVTSGGYQKKTARIIADSILNLHHQGLIGPEREGLSSAATSPTSGPGSSGSALTAI
uniref:Histone deacetylase domain-containing protein n=1 Tax=Periophthalmus magnuspinnatus TaxID=409849 RepID=A0A3B4A704_9GOBI